MTGFGDEAVVVPDVVAPIRAYRGFKVDDDGNLTGYGGTVWPVGEPLQAECHGIAGQTGFFGGMTLSWGPSGALVTSSVDAVPCVQCPSPGKGSHVGYGCGIYGWKAPVDLARHGGTDTVWAEVDLWGAVYEHAHGWRAEWAQPAAIYRMPLTPKARRAADRYGLPLLDPPFSQDDVNRARGPKVNLKKRPSVGIGQTLNSDAFTAVGYASGGLVWSSPIGAQAADAAVRDRIRADVAGLADSLNLPPKRRGLRRG